jgi:hypothetical protein
MLHKEFWGLLFLGFVVWIFMAGDGQARIARTCRPLLWTGNVAVSLTAFATASGAESVQKWSNKLDYGCRYAAWRLIYQDDYNKYLQGEQNGAVAIPAPAQTATPAPTAPTGGSPAPARAPSGITPAAVSPVS